MALGGRRHTGRQARSATFESLEARQLFCFEHVVTNEALDATFTRSSDAHSDVYPDGPTDDGGGGLSLEPVGANPGQMNGNAIFGGGIYGALAANYTARPDGLPLLNSKPGAPFNVFLDFDGWAGSGFSGQENWEPYDTDGNFAAFNATEAGAIAEGWRRMASHLSPFDVNVTTVQPNTASTTKNWTWNIISNNVSGGYAWVNTVGSNRPSGFNDAGHLLSRTSGIMHELGHVFSLQHQSIYNADGEKTTEYRNQYDSIHGVIMGIDYNGTPSKWTYGHPATSAVNAQDDVLIIANKIKPFQPAGGDGFRADDFGSTLPSAFTLTPGAGGVHSTYGIVERLADADAFKLTSPGGWYTLSVIPDSPSALDGKLEVFDANGNLLALSDAQAKIDTAVTMNLAAGDYYAVVKSHGNYGDIGSYEFRAAPANAVNPPATNALPAPGNVATALGAGTAVTISWDAVPGAASYAVERSLDGVAFSTVSGASAVTTTSYTDANLAGSHRYVYRVRAKDATGTGAASAESAITNRPSSVTGARTTQLNGTNIVLDWLERPESGGETAYRIERSTDGVNYTTLTTRNPNVTIYNDTAVTLGQTYHYRIIPTSPYGDGPATTLADVRARVAAVAGLNFTAKSSTSLTLGWNDLPNESGFRIERSLDGANWSTLTTVGAGVRNYTDSGLAAATEYYYRVSGTDPNGVSGVIAPAVFSATTAATTLAAPWASSDIGGVSTGGQGATSLDPASGAVRLVSAGGDVTGTEDQFRFTYQSHTGDGVVIAKVNAVENTNSLARVGVMFRDSTALGSPVAFVGVTAGGTVQFSTRTTTDGTVSSPTSARLSGVAAPYWVKLQRVGNVFTAFASPNGVAWTQVGSPATIAMAATARAGIAGASRDVNKLNTSTLSNVEVKPLNSAPVARGDSVTINEDTPGVIAVLANDTDGDGNTLTVTSVNPAANGTAVLNADQTVTYTPNANFHGLDTFTYSISDGTGGTSAATVTVTVAAVNDAPTLAATPGQSAEAGSGSKSITLTGIGTGAANESQTLAVTATSSDTAVAPHPSVTYHNDGTATLTYTPAAQGTTTITVTVQDNGGVANGGVDTVTRTFNLTVDPPAMPAWLGAGSAVTWDAATKALTVTGAATILADPGADAPVVTANGAAALLTITPAAGGRVTLGGLLLSNGARADVAADGAERVVVINDGASFNLDPTATLDLNDNALVIRNASAASATSQHAAVNNLVRTAFHDFAWDGFGITSSVSQAQVAAGAPATLGVLLNNDGGGNPLFYGDGGGDVPQFVGTAVDSNTVMVRFTRLGDGDLNGVVDTVDFALFQAGYTNSAPYVGFAFGDYDYNGVVDTVDFGLFQAGYGQGGASGLPGEDEEKMR